MSWFFVTAFPNVTPSGNAISQGSVVSVDCDTFCNTTVDFNTSVIFGVTLDAVCQLEDTLNIDGYGVRELDSFSSSIALFDIDNGLVVVKGGTEYNNTNRLEFAGNLTSSGQNSCGMASRANTRK